MENRTAEVGGKITVSYIYRIRIYTLITFTSYLEQHFVTNKMKSFPNRVAYVYGIPLGKKGLNYCLVQVNVLSHHLRQSANERRSSIKMFECHC